jgi:ParB-like chromosome segregation protein Spo0J
LAQGKWIFEMTGMEFHSLANLFPPLEDKELDELAADIRENGLREPIVTFEGKILDGRNRYLACQRARIEPRFEKYTGSNPLALVLSLNLKRRHLDESQRAMVAATIATLRLGTNQHAQICAPSQEAAGDMLNVSRRTVQYAREVLDEGVQELVAKVDRGEVSVSAASDVAKLPKEQQREIVTMDRTARYEALRQIRSSKLEQPCRRSETANAAGHGESAQPRSAAEAQKTRRGLATAFTADPLERRRWPHGRLLIAASFLTLIVSRLACP